MTTTEVVQAYRFALAPTAGQERQLLSHCGAARFAFGTMLAAVKANLDQRAAEKSYGMGDDDLTASMGWSAFSLQKEWKLRRDVAAPWWAENSVYAYRSGCDALAAALQGWSTSRKGTRSGPSVGFPRFKAKARTTLSCSMSEAVRLDPDRRHVVLPRIGSVRVFGSTRKLARRVEAGTARITGSTVSFRRAGGRCHCGCGCSGCWPAPPTSDPGAPIVGGDLGVRDLIVAATPDGVEVARIRAPRPLEKAQAELGRLQRRAARQQGPWDAATGTRRDPSAGWVRTQARIRRLHYRVTNLRENHLHHATTTLAQRHDVIGAETLAVKTMMRRGGTAKRRLNRGLGDAALATVLRQLQYKTIWYGAVLVQADRSFPSSKTCSGCGAVKTTLPLTHRTFTCTTCGTSLDRDLNAAINLARHAARAAGAAGTASTTAAARPPALPLPAAA